MNFPSLSRVIELVSSCLTAELQLRNDGKIMDDIHRTAGATISDLLVFTGMTGLIYV